MELQIQLNMIDDLSKSILIIMREDSMEISGSESERFIGAQKYLVDSFSIASLIDAINQSGYTVTAANYRETDPPCDP